MMVAMAKQSAGVLMYRRSGGEVEVFLVHPGGPFFAKKDAGSWGIPKGEHEKDEEPLTAARREVTAWAMEGDCDPIDLVSNTCSIEWPPRSGRSMEIPEIDQGRWFGLNEARAWIRKEQEPLLDSLATLLLV